MIFLVLFLMWPDSRYDNKEKRIVLAYHSSYYDAVPEPSSTVKGNDRTYQPHSWKQNATSSHCQKVSKMNQFFLDL